MDDHDELKTKWLSEAQSFGLKAGTHTCTIGCSGFGGANDFSRIVATKMEMMMILSAGRRQQVANFRR